MAATQVATQVTTKRLFNIMSSGQALMRSVYYSRQTSSKFLWQKQKEIFSMVGSVSRRWSSSSSSAAEGATQDHDSSASAAPPAVDADTKGYGAVQEDHHQVASRAHDEHSSKGDDQERLSDTGFDMSKVTKPSGDE